MPELMEQNSLQGTWNTPDSESIDSLQQYWCVMEQNSYGDIWNLNMLHSLSSEYIDLVLHIDNKLEDQYNILHHGDYWHGDFARRFDGKKLNATVTHHTTKQIKEFDRRFDGKKYVINEENCAEHRNTKGYGKWPELDKGEKWKSKNGDDESEWANDFLHSPINIVVPNAYLNQLGNSEDKMKARNTYGLFKKIAARSFTFTYRTGKCNEETQDNWAPTS